MIPMIDRTHMPALDLVSHREGDRIDDMKTKPRRSLAIVAVPGKESIAVNRYQSLDIGDRR